MLIKRTDSEQERVYCNKTKAVVETTECGQVVFETKHETMREFIIAHIIEDNKDDGVTREDAIRMLDGHGWEWTLTLTECHWQGEDWSITWEIFKPTNEYIAMLQRHVA